ncbi:MAG: TetR/AcrR family transcriptional regulator [Solirubrobacterales bacterium]|nr:TetR/AcrR family transcriptional regulator [Solirubrobacterales bacterium]
MPGTSQPATDPADGSQSTRDALLGAGMRTFAEHGFTRSRLADIAKEAGLTTGAFYRHFASKQDFYAALFEAYGDALQERLNACPDLLSQFEAWIVVSREYRGVIRASAEVALPGTDAAELRRTLRDACATLLARHLQGMPSWRLTHGSAVMLVDTLAQTILMEAAGWIPERDPADIARALERLVQRGLYVR